MQETGAHDAEQDEGDVHVVARLGLDQNDVKISNETLGEFIRMLGEAIEKK